MTEAEYIAAYQDAYYKARDSGLTTWQASQAADDATQPLLDELEEGAFA